MRSEVKKGSPVSKIGVLRMVKLAHTLIWAFFASCILLIPVLTWHAELRAATVLTGVVLIEVVVLLVNRMRCPLTAVARRYSSDGRDNFDIYLPLWLARFNKHIFGSIFAAALLYLLLAWTAAG